jgi:hypothetical protein
MASKQREKETNKEMGMRGVEGIRVDADLSRIEK